MITTEKVDKMVHKFHRDSAAQVALYYKKAINSSIHSLQFLENDKIRGLPVSIPYNELYVAGKTFVDGAKYDFVPLVVRIGQKETAFASINIDSAREALASMGDYHTLETDLHDSIRKAENRMRSAFLITEGATPQSMVKILEYSKPSIEKQNMKYERALARFNNI